MLGGFGGALGKGSLTFVSRSALASGHAESPGLRKHQSARKGNGRIREADKIDNAYVPVREIEVQTYSLRADGHLLSCEPATVLPLAQRDLLCSEVRRAVLGVKAPRRMAAASQSRR
jgi:urease subunit alpha